MSQAATTEQVAEKRRRLELHSSRGFLD